LPFSFLSTLFFLFVFVDNLLSPLPSFVFAEIIKVVEIHEILPYPLPRFRHSPFGDRIFSPSFPLLLVIEAGDASFLSRPGKPKKRINCLVPRQEHFDMFVVRFPDKTPLKSPTLGT